MGHIKIIKITIIIGLNNLAVDIPRNGSSCPLFPVWIGIKNVGLCGRRKLEDPEKNPAEQGREPQPKRDTRSVNRTQATAV